VGIYLDAAAMLLDFPGILSVFSIAGFETDTGY